MVVGVMETVIVEVVVLALLVAIVYFGLGYIVYTRLANVRGSCDMHLSNRPDHFTNVPGWRERDLSPFFNPTYETVSFPSRQKELQLSAWYAEAAPQASVIIVVDGLGGCKYA